MNLLWKHIFDRVLDHWLTSISVRVAMHIKCWRVCFFHYTWLETFFCILKALHYYLMSFEVVSRTWEDQAMMRNLDGWRMASDICFNFWAWSLKHFFLSKIGVLCPQKRLSPSAVHVIGPHSLPPSDNTVNFLFFCQYTVYSIVDAFARSGEASTTGLIN